MELNHQYHTIGELLDALSPYRSARPGSNLRHERKLNATILRRLQKISPKNIARINEKLRTFALELFEFTLLGA